MIDLPKIGDVVQLVSGSPDLTVTTFQEKSKLVNVSWFLNGEMKWACFPLGALKLKEEETPKA